MTSESIAVEWRQKGNYSFGNYKQSNDDGRRKSYLETALNAYYRSYETSVNDDERSSAAKNYATAMWKLTTVLTALGEKAVQIEFRFREAIRYFSKALELGHRCKRPQSWLSDLQESFDTCVSCAIVYVEAYENRAYILALERYIDVMCEESQKAVCFLKMAVVLNEAGCAALTERDFCTALNAFRDCYRPVQECFRLCGSGGGGDIYSEAMVINDDMVYHMATAEAIQAVKQGDDLLKAAVEDGELLNMDFVYDSMDLYKRAVVATREVEVEMEAIAVSRLGVVYDKVLKMKSKAKEYFKLSIQLAASLHPRNFGTESWYKTCCEALQRYQNEAVNVVDETERQAEREMYLKELEDELKDLREANIGSGPGFLRHLYNKYPPKNTDHKLGDEVLDDGKKMKKALLKAIQHYHPDKQSIDEHGKKWFVLCEEIAKMLNCRYECYKFPSDESSS